MFEAGRWVAKSSSGVRPQLVPAGSLTSVLVPAIAVPYRVSRLPDLRLPPPTQASSSRTSTAARGYTQTTPAQGPLPPPPTATQQTTTTAQGPSPPPPTATQQTTTTLRFEK
jgi:hypothetical protein